MTWSTFIIYLSVSYITYYILNLLSDLILSKNDIFFEPQSSELFYHETESPSPIFYEEQESVEPQHSANIETNENLHGLLTDNSMDLKTITAQAKIALQELNKGIS